jgi:hypothetical protein
MCQQGFGCNLQKRLQSVGDSLQSLCTDSNRLDDIKCSVLHNENKTSSSSGFSTRIFTSEISLKDLAKDLDGRISPLG